MELEKKEESDEGPRMDRPGGGGSLGESEDDDLKVRDEASLRSAFLGDHRSTSLVLVAWDRLFETYFRT